ncbi:MAG: hypothetical protein ACXACP_03995 [Candidatus Hodarchaeales archaeon]|jgi:hypothetical protein
MTLYKITFDYSVIIDQEGIIRYIEPGVQLDNISKIIESLSSFQPIDGTSWPQDYELFQNYPNPFNSSTVINFLLRKPQKIIIKSYAGNGKWINTLLDDNLPIGQHKLLWGGATFSGKRISSGISFYMIQGRDFRESKKMLLLY